jgi:RNA polymerase sigma factor (sigma-70 family)
VRFSPRLYGLVYHMTSSHEDTNDLLQDIFSKAYRSIKGFQGKSSFYTWMHTIAVHMAINFLKKRNRRKTMSLDDVDNGILHDPDFIEATSNGDPSKLKADHSGEALDVEDWRPWEGEPSPGYFYCSDLKVARQQLLQADRSPAVSLKSLGTWGALRYRCVQAKDLCSGWCVIRELPEEHLELQRWAETLDVDYCGEGIPGLALKVFNALLKGKRRSPSLKERKEVLERQAGCCALCGHWNLIMPHLCASWW